MYTGTESVAYDYARFDNRARVRKAAELKPVSRQNEKSVKKTAQATATVKTAFLLLVMAFVACAIVYNYMRVTQLSDETAKAKAALAAYKEEEAQLRIEQEKLYSLPEIEQYVQNNMDMVQLEKSQIEYIELANPDKVERTAEEKRPSYFLSGLLKSFNAVVEYLS